ncbi:MAG: hypothetical protein IPI67_19290 [Myxococcales bacterium]|nr:hypothetical protein [Myxococcales bacterium]
MGKLAQAGGILLWSVLTTGCGGDSRPGNHHFVSSGGSGGSGGFSGGGGSGGVPCTPDPAKGSKIRGNLITYDAYLSDIQPFAGAAELRIAGANCPWVSTTWDAATSPSEDGGPPLFQLESVEPQETSYTHIYQLPESNEAVYPTLVAVNATKDQEIIDGFGMIRAEGVDAAYSQTGTTRDPEKGTVIVQLLDPGTGGPVAGGEVHMGTAASPAFPGLSGWQLGGQTDASGVALMLNATSKPFPGQSWSVSVKLNGVEQQFKCPAENGTVSICWIAIAVGI